MRALHELGTIEMFDHAGRVCLVAARQAAESLGVVSTAAVLDMHIAAASMFAFDREEALAHASRALELSTRLGYERLGALCHMFLSQIHALRVERAAMENFVASATRAAPHDAEIEGSCWAGSRGMLALLEGDRDAAIAHLRRGVELLQNIPNSGPACYRGLYPLVLAVVGRSDAVQAISIARRTGMEVNRGNRGLLALAEAVLAGRRGDSEQASRLAAGAQGDLEPYRGWADVGWSLAGEAALADDWGRPLDWLDPVPLRAVGLDVLAARCDQLLGKKHPDRWGITAREREVLALVTAGLANKEIAVRLALSPRTVEKHVESLLRKAAARSRAHLVALTANER